MNHYDKAEAALLKAIELNPGYEQTFFELISLYEATGKHEKVIETYNKILSSNPKNLGAAVGLGRFYLKMGRSAEAEGIFEELKLRSKSDPDLVKQIALIYLDEKMYEEASETLQLLLKGDVKDLDLYYFLGMAFEGVKKRNKAIASFKMVPETSSYHRSAVVHLGFLYKEEGEDEKAIRVMKEAVEKEPNEPELYLFLGALYEEMKSYDKAMLTLKKGLGHQPDSVRLHFRLGVVYDKAGDKTACIEEMKAVIGMDPTHAEALNYLGYTYAELGTNLDEAEGLIKRAMKHKPNDGYIVDSLGWVYYKKGLYKKAVKFLEEASRLAPDDATILEHLGDACMKVSNSRKGLKYYKKALKNKEKDRKALEEKIESLEIKLDQDA